MPLYEFKCECGEEKEELVPIGTETIKCPKCKGTMKKIISRTNFILKGSGWAFDNYGLKKSKHVTTAKK